MSGVGLPQLAAYAACAALAAASRGAPRRFLTVALLSDVARLATFDADSTVLRTVDGAVLLAPCVAFAWPSWTARVGAVLFAGGTVWFAERSGARDAVYAAAYAGAILAALPFVLVCVRVSIERLLLLALAFATLVFAALFWQWRGDWDPINVSNVVACSLLTAACVVHRREEGRELRVRDAEVAPVAPEQER